jgi:hypothetical protein
VPRLYFCRIVRVCVHDTALQTALASTGSSPFGEALSPVDDGEVADALPPAPDVADPFAFAFAGFSDLLMADATS